MQEDDSGLLGRFILVHDRPFCVWGFDSSKANLRFLDAVDAEYFAYVAETHADHLDGEHSKRAALAIRSAYSHGLEALFALLAAAVQAPDCIAGWLLKYRLDDVQNVVRIVSRGYPHLASRLPIPELSWEGVSLALHRACELPDREREFVMHRRFGQLWQRLAADFLDEQLHLEYNSIKHGFRARSGGTVLRMGAEPSYGVSPPPEGMKVIGASDHGSTYPVIEGLRGGKLHFRIRDHSRLWVPLGLGKALMLISNSIRNIVAGIKVYNGVPGNEVNFSWPQDFNEFDSPWRQSTGVTNVSFGDNIPEAAIQDATPDHIRGAYDLPDVQPGAEMTIGIPIEPGWYFALPRGGSAELVQPMSVVAGASFGEVVFGWALSGQLWPVSRHRYRDRRLWRAVVVKYEELKWLKISPVTPGWYISRSSSGDRLTHWTAWRDGEGRLVLIERLGKGQATSITEISDTEWAVVVGRQGAVPGPRTPN